MSPFIYPIPASGGGSSSLQWLSGGGPPAVGLGVVGAFYLDTITSNIYEKTGAVVWSLRGNISGYNVKSHSIELNFNSSQSIDFLTLEPNDFIFAIAGKLLTPWSDVGSVIKIGSTTNLDKYLLNTDFDLYSPANTIFSKTLNSRLSLAETLRATYTYSDLDSSGKCELIVYYATPKLSVFPTAPLASRAYFAGGGSTVPNQLGTASCDALNMDNDVLAMQAKGSLSIIRRYFSGVNSNTHGYVAGNSQSSELRSEKLAFDNDTVNFVYCGQLTEDRYTSTSTESDLKGYFAGGVNIAASARRLSCNSLDFANDAANMLNVGSLVEPLSGLGAVSSPLNGYFAMGNGGDLSLGITYGYASIDKLDFNNDANAMIPVNATAGSKYNFACFNTDLFGYFAGGQLVGGGYLFSISRFDFSNEALALVTIGASLLNNSGSCAGANSGVKGYVAGGSGGAGALNAVQSLLFANDAAAMVAKPSLIIPRLGLASFQNNYR